MSDPMARPDPDAILRELREMVSDSDPDSAARSRRYCELIGELDDWLSIGGELPADWQHN
ncbi:hypothetical protein SEA_PHRAPPUCCINO_91 [Mycobacterium phage Phrappuccino]|uniref:Uncharacterized protein n=1 Tax=Mycobacterium phage Phrappuccino TaxID=2591223 RepID=A0A514DDS4_9CAUD|nr:HNH endonuclease [Mycobacterium phage Phrappuccino]QDH91766.1 hypothetical protein SEA_PHRAPPUCCINO_91 [Mycobacterium phage Phrappuccino]QIQ63208.1 hypothetical protein SEA_SETTECANDELA_91 [Mycobacterium phage Settecandela]